MYPNQSEARYSPLSVQFSEHTHAYAVCVYIYIVLYVYEVIENHNHTTSGNTNREKEGKYLVGGIPLSGSNEAERTASRKARPTKFVSTYQSKKKACEKNERKKKAYYRQGDGESLY